jgi:hypothetical protein
MILRRLSQALKAQNWTAVVIEFVLLVGGVFLGTQVSNWNQERELRNKALAFGERLREDVRYELWAEQLLIDYYQGVRRHAALALDDLHGRSRLSEEQFLISAYRASQFKFGDRGRATYDELVSTGAIGLIEDEPLRRVAISLFTNPLYDQTTHDARYSEYRALFRESVPYDVQDTLLARCGDREFQPLDYEGIKRVIDYECTLGLPEETVRQAVRALKSQPRLLPSLQRRHADLSTAISDLMRDRAEKTGDR